MDFLGNLNQMIDEGKKRSEKSNKLINELKDNIYTKIECLCNVQLCVEELDRGAMIYYSDNHSVEFKISFRANYMNIEKIKMKNGADILLEMIFSFLSQHKDELVGVDTMTVQISHINEVERWCKINKFDYVGYGKYRLQFVDHSNDFTISFSDTDNNGEPLPGAPGYGIFGRKGTGRLW